MLTSITVFLSLFPHFGHKLRFSTTLFLEKTNLFSSRMPLQVKSIFYKIIVFEKTISVASKLGLFLAKSILIIVNFGSHVVPASNGCTQDKEKKKNSSSKRTHPTTSAVTCYYTELCACSRGHSCFSSLHETCSSVSLVSSKEGN